MTLTADRDILRELARLGGGRFNLDDIRQDGSEMILPATMSLEEAYDFLGFKVSEAASMVEVSETFRYRPHDGAAATGRVLHRTFGALAHVGTPPESQYDSPEPPKVVSVPSGVGETVEVAFGGFALPPFGPQTVFYTETDTVSDPEAGPLFRLRVLCRKSQRDAVAGLFRLIRDELATASLYRGKAFDGQEIPAFVDVHAIDASKVVYSADTMRSLDANVWAAIERTAEFERYGLPLKRAILLHGPFGTGKTLALMLTGQRAIANGWTFLVARPGRDDLLRVMQTATLYEPAVVAFEDVDRLADPGTNGADGITRVLDAFDGIVSKSARVVVVMTTNHVERIHAGMLRPGRLDAVIPVATLDDAAVERLVTLSVPDVMLAEAIDWAAVRQAMDGYLPAFIAEAAQRAIRFALLAVKPGDPPVIDTESLVLAAGTLRDQHDLQRNASTEIEPRHIDAALRGLVDEALADRFDGAEDRRSEIAYDTIDRLDAVYSEASQAANSAAEAEAYGERICDRLDA